MCDLFLPPLCLFFTLVPHSRLCVYVEQFPDVPSFVEDMANAGKMVIVAALDGTYQKRPFGRVLELVPLAESVIKLSAVCMMCKRDAAFSQRISSEREVEVIGGPEKYVALCRACHLRYTSVPLSSLFLFFPQSLHPCTSLTVCVCVCVSAHSPSHIITDFYPAVTNAPNAAAAAAPGAARPSSAPSTPMRASATHAASTSSSCRRI